MSNEETNPLGGTWNTTRLSESHCPKCNYKLGACTHAAGSGKGTPEVGDLTVCLNCGGLLEYTSVEPATYAETPPALLERLPESVKQAILSIQTMQAILAAKGTKKVYRD